MKLLTSFKPKPLSITIVMPLVLGFTVRSGMFLSLKFIYFEMIVNGKVKGVVFFLYRKFMLMPRTFSYKKCTHVENCSSHLFLKVWSAQYKTRKSEVYFPFGSNNADILKRGLKVKLAPNKQLTCYYSIGFYITVYFNYFRHSK